MKKIVIFTLLASSTGLIYPQLKPGVSPEFAKVFEFMDHDTAYQLEKKFSEGLDEKLTKYDSSRISDLVSKLMGTVYVAALLMQTISNTTDLKEAQQLASEYIRYFWEEYGYNYIFRDLGFPKEFLDYLQSALQSVPKSAIKQPIDVRPS